MKKIAMIVMNSVVQDSRVLREADSLAGAGYHVRVFGVRDERAKANFVTRNSGAEIQLSDCKIEAMDFVSRTIASFGIAMCMALSAFAVSITIWPEVLRAGIGVVLVVAAFLWIRVEYEKTIRIIRQMQSEGKSAEYGTLEGFFVRARNLRLVLFRWAMRFTTRNHIVRMIAEFHPDAIHCHDAGTLDIGRRYAASVRWRLKFVFDSHEICSEMNGQTDKHRQEIRDIQTRVAPFLDGFITVNEGVAAVLERDYPRFPAPVIVKNAFRKLPEPVKYDGRLHRLLEIPFQDYIILFQGGIGMHRNLDILVEIARKIGLPFHVVVMGNGPHADNLLAQARSLKNFHLIYGVPQAELIQWTAGASFGIIPYADTSLNHRYCTPNKLWEYPAAGVPIIAANLPELTKAIMENRIGWITQNPMTADFVVDLVNAITPEDWQEKRDACLKFNQSDNWEKYADRLIGLYRRLIP